MKGYVAFCAQLRLPVGFYKMEDWQRVIFIQCHHGKKSQNEGDVEKCHYGQEDS
jgi:hypothetical protein